MRFDLPCARPHQRGSAPPPSWTPPGPRRRFGRRLIALLIGLLAVPLLGEMALRARQGKLFALERLNSPYGEPQTRVPMVLYDSELGYVPRPGFSGTFSYDSSGPKRITITAEGFRSNGGAGAPEGPVIVVVGDSYVFGDQVHDEQTWPARLQALLGQPVLNAGVFGYGVDQIVLRAERLLKEVRPQILIVSVIADDVRRCEYSFRGAWKPFFEIEDGTLRLRNVPAPTDPPPRRLPWLRNSLAYSFLANAVLRRVATDWWFFDGNVKQEHDRGPEVAALLVERLAQTARGCGTDLLLVTQPDYTIDMNGLQPLLACAERLNLPMLDLAPVMQQELARDSSLADQWFFGRVAHMTPAGNAWVAEQVARRLREPDFGAALPRREEGH